MKELTIKANDAGQRLDKFLQKAVPRLPAPLMQKYIRTKRIKRNGKRTTHDTHLAEGDCIALYINDEFFNAAPRRDAFTALTPALRIVYEDEHVLLLDKRPGLSVHEDAHGDRDTLIDHVKAYLYQTHAWDPAAEHSFTPALCNRIDRNTGGIVIAAKTAPALRILNEKIKRRELSKYYVCIVSGAPRPASGRLRGYLWKDAKKNLVYVRQTPSPGAKPAETRYRTLAVRGDLSLLECELITGRTHQIRAQMAAAGHPLLGDGKYGDYALNRKYKRQIQALYSYRLTFDFQTPAGELSYLNGKTFSVSDIDFVQRYFPEFRMRG